MFMCIHTVEKLGRNTKYDICDDDCIIQHFRRFIASRYKYMINNEERREEEDG